MSATERLELSQIDPRLSRLRLTNPQDLQLLRESLQRPGAIRYPALVSTAVEPGHWVLVDGFKRLRVAREMGETHLWVQTVQLDAAHATAAILHSNQPREGLSKLEEAWIVHSLHRDHALMQTKVAELLNRDTSWVCRRLKLIRELDESLQEDVRQGALTATTACQLSQLQRDNQQAAARAVIDEGMSSRECTRLVQKLLDTRDEQAAREILDDPWSYIDPADSPAERTRGDDPLLSKDGNRLRRSLLSWQRACGRLTEELRGASAADARVLAPLIQDGVTAGTRAIRQLETTHSSCSVHQPTRQGEPDRQSPAP
jgi:ParB/RepB/Spo0J family partition protein